MPASTATVEALTAEVRVLMVGSRQVTLSVARQLDEVAWWDITPFGRISMNTKPAFSEADRVEVIGRSEDGSLVRSSASRMRYRCEHRQDGGKVIINGEECTYRACKREDCGHYHGHTWIGTDEQFNEWNGLPLIVLAGLR